jgi:hypothetical protein
MTQRLEGYDPRWWIRIGRGSGGDATATGRLTHISDHCTSLGSGDGFGGKFCGAYCPTLRPPRGRPSRIKSRLCPVLLSEAPGSDLSLGSAVGMVRVARRARRPPSLLYRRGEANARALWRDRVLRPRARACASRRRTSRPAKMWRGFCRGTRVSDKMPFLGRASCVGDSQKIDCEKN